MGVHHGELADFRSGAVELDSYRAIENSAHVVADAILKLSDVNMLLRMTMSGDSRDCL